MRFTQDAGRPIKAGDQIEVWEYDKFPPGSVVGRPAMVVNHNGTLENELLALSRVDSSPIEVLGMRLHFPDGRSSDTGLRVRGNSKQPNLQVGVARPRSAPGSLTPRRRRWLPEL